MTLRFVKTSILSSTDGIEFGNEVSVDSEEVIKARLAAEAAKNKPLYQQLAEIKERKQEEYNENTKKLFAPPKALDEDEIEFFNEIEEAKQKVALANRKHDDIELESFRQARKIDMLNNNNVNGTAPLIKFLSSKKVEPTNPTVHFTVKRKLSNVNDSKFEVNIQDNKKQSNKNSSNDYDVTHTMHKDTTTTTTTDNVIETQSLFAAYESDSD